jgi:hypothetical protein
MYQVRLRTDPRLTENLNKLRTISGPTIKRRMDVEVKRVQRGLMVSLAAMEPGQPRYPIRWTSEKQRRYVMAKLRREGNLPYQRTHALVRGWQVPKYIDVRGGYLSVKHAWGKIGYVVGNPAQPGWQQRFHMITGWPTQRRMEAMLEFWKDEATKGLQKAFDDTVREIIYGR